MAQTVCGRRERFLLGFGRAGLMPLPLLAKALQDRERAAFAGGHIEPVVSRIDRKLIPVKQEAHIVERRQSNRDGADEFVRFAIDNIDKAGWIRDVNEVGSHFDVLS
jgi:hypothetical protein